VKAIMLSKIFLFYKRHSGSWLWILHRLTGVALVVYICLHLWELHTLAYETPDAFNHKMLTFQSLGFKFIEWMLLGVVLVHALNGIRIMFVDFFGGARYHKRLNWIMVVLFVVLMGFAGYPMFFEKLLATL
jgi:succinate dehydrogenase / fumarate reductase cytochrome b subunit